MLHPSMLTAFGGPSTAYASRPLARCRYRRYEMADQSLRIYSLSIPLLAAAGTLGGPQSNSIPLFRIPGTAYGGGINIVRWDYATNVVMASGSAPAVRLVTQTATNAAIATICANGTAATTAGTAVSGTITTAWVPGTVGWLACEYTHATYGGSSPAYLNLSIQYYPGRGSA